jgi:flagellar FliL protein
MSSATAKIEHAPAADKAAGEKKAGGGVKKMVLLALPVVLMLAGAGLWFSGILPHLLGMGHKPAVALAEAPAAAPPVFVEVPELIANLNAGDRRQAYAKIAARVELAQVADKPMVTADMPKLQDLFQTYLREMRPDELRGSAGIWRLREELIARANVAVAPARVTDVLFTEMLIQ